MSDVTAALDRLREAASELPLFEWDQPPTFAPGLPNHRTSTHGENLPADALSFLRACSHIAAADVHNGYFIGGPDSFAPVDRQAPHPHEADVDGELRPLIKIGSDGAGNAFLMALGPSNLIFKWHHETDLLEPIAQSFSTFLGVIATDWEHYVSGDSSHKFVSG